MSTHLDQKYRDSISLSAYVNVWFLAPRIVTRCIDCSAVLAALGAVEAYMRGFILVHWED